MWESQRSKNNTFGGKTSWVSLWTVLWLFLNVDLFSFFLQLLILRLFFKFYSIFIIHILFNVSLTPKEWLKKEKPAPGSINTHFLKKKKRSVSQWKKKTHPFEISRLGLNSAHHRWSSRWTGESWCVCVSTRLMEETTKILCHMFEPQWTLTQDCLRTLLCTWRQLEDLSKR